MEPHQYVDVIRNETTRLVAAARRAGPAAAVPSCPGWTVTDLLVHLGTVQRWATGMVEQRAGAAEAPTPEAHPDDPTGLLEWVEAGAGRMADVFAATPVETPMWTFAGPGPARFWFRRQAHETALHRVDAELAAGAFTPLDPEVARDGIDEFLDVVVPFRLAQRLAGTGETVHLHCTDGEGEWLVRCTTDGPEVERIHAKGDVAARGSASDLLLAVRGRIGVSDLEVFGDEAVLVRFIDHARL